MVDFTFISAWICTIIFSAAVGWVARAMSPNLNILVCPMSWTAWFRHIFTKENFLFLKSPQPVLEGQASQYPLTPNPLTPEPIIAAPEARAHVFDDMPPLDQVRAEASAILNSEKVWEGLGSIEDEEWWDDNAQPNVATRAPAMGQAIAFSNSPSSNSSNQPWSECRLLSGLVVRPHQS